MTITDKNTDKVTQLYRHFDADGNLLYVGISLSALKRLAQHSQSAQWYCQIARVSIEHFPTREEALDAEALAIHRENPLHNISRPHPKPQRVGGWQAFRDGPDYSPPKEFVRLNLWNDADIEKMSGDPLWFERYQRHLWEETLSDIDRDAYLNYWYRYMIAADVAA